MGPCLCAQVIPKWWLFGRDAERGRHRIAAPGGWGNFRWRVGDMVRCDAPHRDAPAQGVRITPR